jgi:hypothetical protein
MRTVRSALALALMSAPLLLAGAAFADARPPVVAVFGIRDASEVLSSAERERLARYLAVRMAEGGRYLIVPESDLQQAIRAQKKASYEACYEEACQIEIGRELAAEKTFVTEIVRLGDSCVVTSVLFDLQKAASEQAATERGACDLNALVRLVEVVSSRLVGSARGHDPRTETETRLQPPTETKASAVVRKSAMKFRFDTGEEDLAFDVEFFGPDGQSHPCPESVRLGVSCLVENVAFGEARYRVSAKGLESLSDTIRVEDSQEIVTFPVREIASTGNIVAWTFGGLGMVAGAALTSTGLGIDSSGMVYAGIPTFLVGAGVCVAGFLIHGRIAVDDSVFAYFRF